MAESTRRRILNSKHAEMIAARRFFLLFLFLLGSLVLYPLTEGNGSRYYLFRFLGSAAVLLSVYAVSFRRGVLLVAALLAVPAFLGRVILFEFDASALSVIRITLSLAFDVFIVVVIFRRVFSHDKPNAETVFGALCIYLLVGFGFTSLYGLISSFDPHAFHLDLASQPAHRPRSLRLHLLQLRNDQLPRRRRHHSRLRRSPQSHRHRRNPRSPLPGRSHLPAHGGIPHPQLDEEHNRYTR